MMKNDMRMKLFVIRSRNTENAASKIKNEVILKKNTVYNALYGVLTAIISRQCRNLGDSVTGQILYCKNYGNIIFCTE